MKESNRQSQQATKLFDHIRELQVRFMACTGLMILIGVIAYCFYEQILNFLRTPLEMPLYYDSPAGSFAFVMKICFMVAIMFAMPVIIYNIIMFIRPAYINKLSKKRVYFTSILSSFLAIAGATFAFALVLPGALEFFDGFRVNGLNALISADKYLNFVTSVVTTFIIAFQLPIVMIIIDTIKPMSPKKLLKFEKWAILISLTVSLFTPFAFDPMTSLLVALPIFGLYNISIVIILTQQAIRRHKKLNENKAVIFKPNKAEQKNQNIDEIIESIEQTNPKITTDKQPILNAVHPHMDIIGHVQATNKVQPANWVIERNKKREALMRQQVHVFSDINRVRPRIVAS